MQKHASLEDFYNSLEEEKFTLVAELRILLLEVEPRLQEHLKWNAPSYVLDGEDRITFNLMNKQEAVKLVFHMGVTRRENKHGTPVMYDDTGLIEWSSDIRGVITFMTIEDVHSRYDVLRAIVKKWLSIPVEADK